mgnify:CR=1 FL=1
MIQIHSLQACGFLAQPPRRPAQSGFTLLELCIAGVLLALLLALALPSFAEQIRKGRRADAHALAATLSHAQERFRLTHKRFAGSVEELAHEGITSSSAAGHYTLSLGEGTAIGYSFSLRPASGSPQVEDRSCAEFKVQMLRGALLRSAKNAEGADSTLACWPQ